jgi:hypothetical protein
MATPKLEVQGTLTRQNATHRWPRPSLASKDERRGALLVQPPPVNGLLEGFEHSKNSRGVLWLAK